MSLLLGTTSLALLKYCSDWETLPARKDCIPAWISVRGSCSLIDDGGVDAWSDVSGEFF